jgi:hypothetical protein
VLGHAFVKGTEGIEDQISKRNSILCARGLECNSLELCIGNFMDVGKK